MPSQIEFHSGSTIKLLLLASVPSVGYAVYKVPPSCVPVMPPSSLIVTADSLENAQYRVRLNAAGDVASIYDKAVKREMLTAPMRLSFQYENPSQYPAWNMDYEDQIKPAEGFVDGPAQITIS